MNELLNTLDGIDTKDKPIITILTTNHLESINKAFLRAGRIDSLIHLGPLTRETAQQFISKFAVDASGTSLVDHSADYSEAAKALEGIVPAFTSEILNKAKMYAMHRDGKGDILTPDDIRIAALSFKKHIELTTISKEFSKEEVVARSLKAAIEGLRKVSAPVALLKGDGKKEDKEDREDENLIL
jgi:ATP-dependent 26S proteasome regulatory subunit